MGNLFGKRAAIVSYRLGMADGVSVTAAQWASALQLIGMRVRTVAGDGEPDVTVPGLALDAERPPSRHELAAALDDADVVIADNICSLPMNMAAGDAVADYLRGRPAVLRHHDLPWEREQYVRLTTWPRDDPAWRHVTINEQARLALAIQQAGQRHLPGRVARLEQAHRPHLHDGEPSRPGVPVRLVARSCGSGFIA